MNNFINLIARNTAVLLMITTYACKRHYTIADNMVTVLLNSEDFSVDVMSVLYASSLKLYGVTYKDNKTIQAIRDDMKYLLSIKRGELKDD